jgi:hypothetical protein
MVSSRFLLVVSLFVASVAQAGRVVPMVPQIKPAPPQELREKYQEAVGRGLGGESEVVAPSEVRTRLSSPELAECAGGPCMARVAQALHADRVVVTEIDQVGKNYAIRMRVFDAAGQELGKASDGCDICSVREADAAVTRVAGKVAPLTVVKTPPKTEEAGPEAPRATPVAKEADAPPKPAPAVEAAASRPAPAEGGQPAPTDRATDTRGGGFPYRPVAIGSFGVAVVALIATIGFGVYATKENQTTCKGVNYTTGDNTCPNIYKGNAAPAAVFGVVTALAAGTGALMLFLDARHRKRSPTITAAPTRDGFAVGASVEF